MSLRSIEIISPAGMISDKTEQLIKRVISNIERNNRTKYAYDFKVTRDMSKASRFSGGVMPPLIIINGILEFSARMPDMKSLEARLTTIIRS